MTHGSRSGSSPPWRQGFRVRVRKGRRMRGDRCVRHRVRGADREMPALPPEKRCLGKGHARVRRRHRLGDGQAASSRMGIGLFIEDGAYTTVAAAVSILLVLTLLFSAATAVWSTSRAGDVQASADATALAGANVVSSYYTVATTLDACILSLGLAGLVTVGVGLVGLLVPGANAIASETVDAGIRIIEARNDFAESASEGLQTLEESLPYLVAANATRTCSAQDTESITYTGTALAVPSDSASDFPALEGEAIETEELESVAEDLDEAADELVEAQEATADAKEEAWLADCGSDGMNMQERAAALSGISDADNPDYASSITWDPEVALDRARAYYKWRMNNVTAEGSDDESLADAAARRAFYEYAYETLEDAEVTESDGKVTSTVELLPKNTSEVKNTSLYTDAVWPSTYEDGVLTLHYSSSCSGATGESGGLVSLSDIDSGTVQECDVCHFSVGDLGKTVSATNFSNGFEYHLRAFTLALEEYVECRNEELELEAETQESAEAAADVFEDALSTLAGKRPRIAPPGRNGCVALVVSGEIDSPEELDSTFATSAELSSRGAVSAAVLATDEASDGSNVLSSFLSGLESEYDGGVVGLVGSVMDLWGTLLVSYGDLSDSLDDLMDDLLGGLDTAGSGTVATWLSERIDGVVTGFGLEPVSLDLRRPVLTDSSNVIENSDMAELADVQELLRSLPLGSTDLEELLEALGYEVGDYIESLEFTVAEIEIGSVSIPLTVRVSDLTGILDGGSS